MFYMYNKSGGEGGGGRAKARGAWLFRFSTSASNAHSGNLFVYKKCPWVSLVFIVIYCITSCEKNRKHRRVVAETRMVVKQK